MRRLGAPANPYLASRELLAAGIAVWLLLGLTWWVYQPGSSGAFLFDDWANLPVLGQRGGVDSADSFVGYLISGIAGPTGRPVALLSFLLDANAWPADAAPFKHTNVLLHLLNGALLAWLLFRLTRLLGHAQGCAGSIR